jgi:hypothetical protein
MAIVLSNGVTNINGTPGINSDVFANRPAATDVAPGSIYIATDTGVIYQSDGATWSTIGGGGGPTPGIDSVLAVGQLLTTGRTIDANTNFLHIDGITNFRVRSGGIDVFRHNTGTGTRIAEGSSVYTVSTTGMNTAAPTGGGSVAQQGLSFVWATRSFTFGITGLGGNESKIDILDTSQQIYFSNKGVTNGIYCDFSNKLYLFGRLNSTSEQNLEIDEVNQLTRTKFAGIVNGFSLDYSTTIFQFGYLDNTVNPDTFININGNANLIEAAHNGNKNGLSLNFTAGNRIFQLGDYQGIFDSTKIILDDTNTSILISSNQTTGTTTIEGNSLVFTGANLESVVAPTIPAANWLNVTVNGIAYKIALES